MKVKKCVGDYVSLQRGLTYKGALVGEPGPALLGLGSIVPGGGFRHDYKTYGGECPSALMLKPGDLFVSLKGATKDGEMIGSVARVPPTVPTGRLTQDTVGLRFHDGDRETVSFLYWVLRTPQYRDYCRGRATGSAVVALSRSDFLSYPVPELTDGRRRLVQLFDAIEDKIELIRKRNRTLEAMARAIFQSWFVDFDPVKAKAAGRTPPGLSPGLAALFPDGFEDSPLGPIPAGWRVGTVGDNFRLTMGQSPPGETYNESSEGPPFYQGCTDFGFRFPTRRVYCTAPTRMAEHGDTLVSVRAPVGDVNIAMERCAIGRGVAAVRHIRGSRSLTYHAMHNLGSHFNTFEAEGTVFGSINKTDFAKLPFIESADALLDAFERNVSPLDDQVEVLERESVTLAALRDALLPKLISGELRVPDAERIVARTT